MGVGVGTALVVAAVVGAAAAGTAAGVQHQQGRRTAAQTRRAGRAAFRARDAAQKKLEAAEGVAKETGIQRRARAKQRRILGAAQGRQSTILTSPTGTVGESSQGQRSLLGQ